MEFLGFILPTLMALMLACVVFWLYFSICRHISVSNKGSLLAGILITIASVLILNLLFYHFGYSIKFVIISIFAYLMLLLAAIDFKTQMLPDIITKPLIALGLLQGYMGVFTDFSSSIMGAIGGYMVLWSVNFAFRCRRGVDGMGYGDFKLLAAICAWTGIKMLPFILLVSSILGIFVALIIIKLTKSNIKAPTPFGPTLVFTGFIAILYGNNIINWYLKLLQLG